MELYSDVKDDVTQSQNLARPTKYKRVQICSVGLSKWTSELTEWLLTGANVAF